MFNHISLRLTWIKKSSFSWPKKKTQTSINIYLQSFSSFFYILFELDCIFKSTSIAYCSRDLSGVVVVALISCTFSDERCYSACLADKCSSSLFNIVYYCSSSTIAYKATIYNNRLKVRRSQLIVCHSTNKKNERKTFVGKSTLSAINWDRCVLKWKHKDDCCWTI